MTWNWGLASDGVSAEMELAFVTTFGVHRSDKWERGAEFWGKYSPSPAADWQGVRIR